MVRLICDRALFTPTRRIKDILEEQIFLFSETGVTYLTGKDQITFLSVI